MIKPQKKRDGDCWILYDPELVHAPSERLFDLEYLSQKGTVDQPIGGRGTSYFFSVAGQDRVLRHYRRGGLIGKIILDQYIGLSLTMSRSWQEWQLLSILYSEGFPVPRPVAAGIRRSFLFYRADLITIQIPETTTLASVLDVGDLTLDCWFSIGECIRVFHDRGVYHADLNAHNILLNKDDKVFLLDFDRGRIRRDGAWKQSNLKRLQRSLLKLSGQNEMFSFADKDWRSLLSGYHHLSVE